MLPKIRIFEIPSLKTDIDNFYLQTKFGVNLTTLWAKKRAGVQKLATFPTKGDFLYILRHLVIPTLTFPSVKSQLLELERSLSTFWKLET